MPDSNFLRHLLATIAYRLAKSVNKVVPAFYEMEPPSGIRKPKEIIRHMSQVLAFSIKVLDQMHPETLEQRDGETELSRFYQLLEQLDNRLAKEDISAELSLQFIQGPLADILTHIGQIAMLRRYFNDPVQGENFMKANIKIGSLKLEEQQLSKDLFKKD